MDYKFLDSNTDIKDIIYNNREKIDKFLFKHLSSEAEKAIDFFNTEGKLLYVHGFLGTGKRQFINYVSDFVNKDVIKLEYYCKSSTVCDDILLSFIDIIEKNALANAVIHTAKITTLAVKFQQYLSSIKKPFLIILHSYDDILPENTELVSNCLSEVLKSSNVKIIISTRAMPHNLIKDNEPDRKIFIKAFPKNLFNFVMEFYNISGTTEEIDNLYKQTRGYYYYTVLAAKVIQETKSTISEFLKKLEMSGMTFDSFLGYTYINLIPTAIRNFFWFIRIIRHGLSLNALAVIGIYDEFALEYLMNNYIIFQVGDMIYVHDYFQQDVEVDIPQKTEVKLHKYIVTIYEKELKASLSNRLILMSRQGLRAEIDYHKKRITELENSDKKLKDKPNIKQTASEKPKEEEHVQRQVHSGISDKMISAQKLAEDKKYRDAIQAFQKIIEEDKPDENTLAEIRVELARAYRATNDLKMAQHCYETAEKYYSKKGEQINLSYLYYEMTSLYFEVYKTDRAINTIKKVVYSVDTPQSLMVDACTLLGNIYSETKNYDEASKYYQKALESINENSEEKGLAELYFKYALMCDENGDTKTAFEYYNKCILLNENNPYKALSYSNLGSCYYENNNLSDAEDCFKKAYDIEKSNNNYDGIYYTASYLAKIYIETDKSKALEFLLEAKQSAEFINEDYYILESTIALGDYYYDHKDKIKEAATEYFKALKVSRNYGDMVDISKIEERVKDMKFRLNPKDFERLEKTYG